MHKHQFRADEIQQLVMPLDVSLGMEYLHRHNVYHGELRSANLLVTHDWRLKIANLHPSRGPRMPEGGGLYDTVRGSRPVSAATVSCVRSRSTLRFAGGCSGRLGIDSALDSA